MTQQDIKFGPKLGGSRDIYAQLREAKTRVGQRVRVTVPGWLDSFVTEITEVKWEGSAPKVRVGDQTYFLGNRANGHPTPGHDWKVELEVLAPELPEEPGLYQETLYGADVANAVTYRFTDHLGWVNAIDNEPLSEDRLANVKANYRSGHLVRLVREKF